ncbi:uncharacterized protein LOC102679447 [Apis dorsata]|uniref:uncharacterized protein LOC102679447 n=1 Tax=Apis dorsata TaxID=7462 RepID=UPI0003DF52C1|nr:uncharacterized protein LOC102679447 [Apis dorsata]
MERVWRRVQGAGRRSATARCGCPVQPCQLHVDQRAKRGGGRKSRGGPQTIVCGCQVQPCPVHPVLIRVRRTRPGVGNCDCPPESQPCPHVARTSAIRRIRRCDCPERPCRHSAAGGGTRHRVSVQPSSPTFSQASQSNQQQQQQPCECAERINCTHTGGGGGECECGEEAKPCSHTVRQRISHS